MKKYEITFVVSESYTEDRAADIAKDVKKLIETHGGKVEKEVFWGKRKLIYKIAKNSFGYYYVFIFNIESEKANKLNKELNLNEKILRYLIVDFIEGSPFFEEGTPETGGKEKVRKPVRARVEDKEVASSQELVAREEGKEEVKKPIRRAAKKEVVEELVAEPEEKVEDVETASSEQLVASEEKPEEKIEEEPKEQVEEEKPEPEVKEVKEEKVEKEVKDEEMAERKPERRQMTEEERKEQLEKKLAELLKDEEL
jgi:small subunit ribosomal protein S6